MTDPRYSDGERAELGDTVAFLIGDVEHEGQLAALYPRKHEAKVRFADHSDTNRNGTGKLKTRTVPIAEIDLLRREG